MAQDIPFRLQRERSMITTLNSGNHRVRIYTGGVEVASKVFEPNQQSQAPERELTQKIALREQTFIKPVKGRTKFSAVAWTGGANEWAATTRDAFANDPVNLQAVEGRANVAKSMHLASEWMPTSTAFHCTNLAQMTNVLKACDLAVTPIDQDAIINGGTIDGVEFDGVRSCTLAAGAVMTELSVAPSATPETVQVTAAPKVTSTTGPVEGETPAAVAPNGATHESETDSPALVTTGDATLPWTLGLADAALVGLTALELQHRRKAQKSWTTRSSSPVASCAWRGSSSSRHR